MMDFQHNLEDGYSYILAKKEGLLIGILGYIPTFLYDSALKKELQYSTVSWFVDLEARIPGLGMLLFRNLLTEKKASFCYALSISKQAFVMHEVLGYKIGWMKHAYIVNHTIKEFKILQKNLLSKKLTGNGRNELQLLQLDNFDELTAEFEGSIEVVPTKSATYFKNRFLMHPIYQYEVYGILTEGKLEALFATRSVQANNANAIRLVDFVGNLKLLYNIAPELQNLLVIKKAEYIDIYYSGLNQKALELSGFISRSKESDTIVPNYFEPFEASNIELNFAYRFINKEDKRKVLLFKADGDQDRPNNIS